jgi:hypothetical protein
MEPADAKDATLAKDPKDAALPTDRTESCEQMESTEFSDHSDHTPASLGPPRAHGDWASGGSHVPGDDVARAAVPACGAAMGPVPEEEPFR